MIKYGKYVYPAIFKKDEDGYSIFFPDLENCYTQGDDIEDGIEMAEDVLALMLYDYEIENKPIPAPSNIKSIVADEDDFVTLVKCDTMEYRKMYNNKAVKKTLTIPEWLNLEAEKQSVNFSKVLQDALMQILDGKRI